MAHCIVSADRLGEHPICLVHGSPAPCWHDGEPPARVPLHWDDVEGMEKTVTNWFLRTGGLRLAYVHRGCLRENDRQGTPHELTAECWCTPVFLLPGADAIPDALGQVVSQAL